jgi:2-dehydropantoate 2-reductase
LVKTIVVIGAGPVGSILSAHLLKSGRDVCLVDILRERLLAMQKNGLKLKDPRHQVIGDFVVFPQKIVFSAREIKNKPDFIFVCTKTYNLMDVAVEISNVFSPPPRVVIFQNGLDNEEQMAEVLGAENILRCVINYAGMMPSDTEAEITFFNRPNYIGVMDTANVFAAREIADMLTETGLETIYTEDIKKPEWEKAILNASLAPVSAVTGLTMKEVMDYVPLRQMVEKLLGESIQVAGTSGIEFSNHFYEYCLAYLGKGGYHKPSMLLDIEKGGKTEIDFLNGKIVEYGEKLNIPVSYNRMITAITKGLEQKKVR